MNTTRHDYYYVLIARTILITFIHWRMYDSSARRYPLAARTRIHNILYIEHIVLTLLTEPSLLETANPVLVITY